MSISSKVVLEFDNHKADVDTPIAVAAVRALTAVLQDSHASTLMELQQELRVASDALKKHGASLGTTISLESGCDLFMRHVTRAFLDQSDFASCLAVLCERAEQFAELSLRSRNKIALTSHSFIRDNHTVLLHGFSRVTLCVLLEAAKTKHFQVVITEGRPKNGGYKAAKALHKAGIPVTVVLDSAMAYTMSKVDLVLVGAEAVVESGGIVNKIGTYTLAVVAKALNKPFYVAAESYKFARLFPLNQKDLPERRDQQKPLTPLPYDHSKSTSICDDEINSGYEVDNPSCDYTPPQFITLLFTDLGVFTPSAVSDELIKLYQ